jgi:hypothetical protein
VHGTGCVVTPGDDRWDELSGSFPAHRGARAIIEVTAQRVSDSCGYSVPLMDFSAERTRLDDWVEARTDEDLQEYRATRNARSIDGLAGL